MRRTKAVLRDVIGAGAICGIGELQAIRDPGEKTGMGLMVDATKLALADANLEISDIDGLLVHSPDDFLNLLYFPAYFAEYLELDVRYADQVDLAGAAAAGMVWRAMAAISAGQCRNVLCVAGTVRDRYGYYHRADQPHPAKSEFQDPFGPMAVNTEYALMAMRHMHEYGTTSEQLAKIAADQRRSGALNPESLYPNQTVTVEEVLESRLICDPLRLLEIVRPTSGAAAFVIRAADQVADSGNDPVWLRGASERHDGYISLGRANFIETGIRKTGPEAVEMAGIRHEDIDLVSVYDSYTITTLLTIEEAGFCPTGQGGPFVAERDLSYAGDFPVNSHGGQLCVGQAGMAGGMSHVTEAVRQLRGEGGSRQVAGCDLAFVHGNGGVFTDHVSIVLGKER